MQTTLAGISYVNAYFVVYIANSTVQSSAGHSHAAAQVGQVIGFSIEIGVRLVELLIERVQRHIIRVHSTDRR